LILDERLVVRRVDTEGAPLYQKLDPLRRITPVPGAVSEIGVRGTIRAVHFSIQEQLVSRNLEQFRGGLEFKAHGLLYH